MFTCYMKAEKAIKVQFPFNDFSVQVKAVRNHQGHTDEGVHL